MLSWQYLYYNNEIKAEPDSHPSYSSIIDSNSISYDFQSFLFYYFKKNLKGLFYE